MKDEFRQQEEALKSLEKQAQKYKTEGKTEAGHRLEYQIQILKVNLEYRLVYSLTGKFWNLDQTLFQTLKL